MKKLTLLLTALLLVDAGAQTAPSSPPAAKSRAGSPGANRGAKPVLPDPELLDGSKFEPEKRPMYGMLSEIEMGEEEGGPQDRVSPNSGPAGEPPPEGQQQQQGGGGQQPPQSQPEGGSAEKIAEGPEAKPEGIQAQKLQVPPGAQAGPQGAQSGPQGAARNMQIGDATLQIQTVPNSPEMVGAQQASNAQQYEKKVPAGQQTNNRNQGVEKGKVMPKGL